MSKSHRSSNHSFGRLPKVRGANPNPILEQQQVFFFWLVFFFFFWLLFWFFVFFLVFGCLGFLLFFLGGCFVFFGFLVFGLTAGWWVGAMLN